MAGALLCRPTISKYNKSTKQYSYECFKKQDDIDGSLHASYLSLLSGSRYIV
jgi:hypothetical protein